MTNRAIYKFSLDCGRMGDLSGVFIAEKADILARMGAEIAYGEVLGKHSDIVQELTEEQLQLVSDNPNDIQLLERLGIVSVGTNPLEYDYRPKGGEWIKGVV